MQFEEFREQEIEILIEAVDAWIDKDFGGEIMTDMLSMMLGDEGSPERKEKMKQDREKDRIEAKQAKTLRKEQAIVLKAKLLKIRDSIVAQNIGRTTTT